MAVMTRILRAFSLLLFLLLSETARADWSFVRGDCNGDGSLDVTDPITLLGALYGPDPFPNCQDACDSTDDGLIDLADPVYLLGSVFGTGPLPTMPFPVCGLDPTSDSLDCVGPLASCPNTEFPPQITSTPPPAATETELYTYDVEATDGDEGDTVSFSLQMFPPGATIDSQSGVITWTPTDMQSGTHGFIVRASDLIGQFDDQAWTVDVVHIPPDPVEVAPPNDDTVATILASSSQFLYRGPDPIQTGVAPGTIEPRRAAVLRGRVLDPQGQPILGVQISIANAAEFGQTVSRADGRFDMAVNGGGYLWVTYEKHGYPRVQRLCKPRWQDYDVLPDVVLTPYDTEVTTIESSSPDPIQAARGSVITDGDGTRCATLLFSQGTLAELEFPGGASQTLDAWNVRATEFTVGPDGPLAMPASLPPTSAYTYCVELSVDEAVNSGASTVTFDQPIVFFLENFLDFPIGEPVPVGFYDSSNLQWSPSDSGRVVEIIAIDGGVAQVDIDGDGQSEDPGDPDDLADLLALGLTTPVLTEVGELYSVGQSLWTFQVTHFSAWDANWGIWPPADAVGGGSADSSFHDLPPHLSSQACGSVIEIEQQVLGERIPIAGTPFDLVYRSKRMPGYAANRTVDVKLSGDTIPASLHHIGVQIHIAGRIIEQEFPPDPNQTFQYTWDGLDAYGRPVLGAHTANVRIGYFYEPVYFRVDRFGYNGTPGQGVYATPTRDFLELPTFIQVKLGNPTSGPSQSLGGWTIDVHHSYDPLGRVLYLGDGRVRDPETTSTIRDVITRVAGGGSATGDGIPALDALLPNLVNVKAAPDGGYYIAELFRIRHVDSEGIITTFAGTGVPGPNGNPTGDGGPAVEAQFGQIHGMDIHPDGSIYVVDSSFVRRITIDGIIDRICGSADSGNPRQDAQALEVYLDAPRDVAIDPFGGFYITDRAIQFGNGTELLRVNADGFVTQLADLGPAGTHAGGVALTVEGDVIAGYGAGDPDSAALMRVYPSGGVERIAGSLNSVCTDLSDPCGDGGPAIDALLSFPNFVQITSAGDILVSDGALRIRRLDNDGVITNYAGNGAQAPPQVEGGTATRSNATPLGFGVTPAGGVLFANLNTQTIRRVGAPFPGFDDGEIAIVSEDGSEIWVFDSVGRHLRTAHALTNATLFDFSYQDDLLSSIEDGDGNVTVIQRATDGTPMAIVAPHGQMTALLADATGHLQSIMNPETESNAFEYSESGLLTSTADPKLNEKSYGYDSLGRLLTAEDAGGAVQTLSRSQLARGFQVTHTSADGVSSVHVVERLTDGAMRFSVTNSSCSCDVETFDHENGVRQTFFPDGSEVLEAFEPDPRWGMQSPVPDFYQVSLPSGLSAVVREQRSVVLQDPDNPFAVLSESTTVEVNGEAYTRTFDSSLGWALESPGGRLVTLQTDSLGRVVSIDLPATYPLELTYDSFGRLAQFMHGILGDARAVTFDYDVQGYLQRMVDSLSRETILSHDQTGRLLSQQNPGQVPILIVPDQASNTISISPPGRPDHTFDYDPNNNLTLYRPPDIASDVDDTEYVYNVDRQLIGALMPDGSNVTYDYVASRLVLVTHDHDTVSFVYDPQTGQLESVASNDLTLNYGYDGPLMTSVAWASSWPALDGHTISYSYDDQFREASQAVDGNVVDYVYDEDGYLVQVGALTLSRDASTGLVTGTSLGGVSDGYTYTSFGEVLTYVASFAGVEFYSVEYAYDSLGRVASKIESVDGTTTEYEYSYDQAGRLESVIADSSVAAAYTYDQNGNRTAYDGVLGSFSALYDVRDRMLTYGQQGFTYSAADQLLTKSSGTEVTAYVYDAFGNLRSVMLPGAMEPIDFLVDPWNRRVGKATSGTITEGYLFQDALRPVAKLDSSGNIVQRFVYGDRNNTLEYLEAAAATYRVISDRRGSPLLIVDTVTGEIAQRIVRDEFGRILLDSAPGFLCVDFAGGFREESTGFVRFGARDYDPCVGRWTTRDPVGFSGGSANLFAYAMNDPINFVDPSGLASETAESGTWLKQIPGHEKLDSLDPEFREKALEVIRIMHGKGYKLRVLWGRRTKRENDALGKNASKNSLHLEGKAVDLINRIDPYPKNKDHPYYRDLKEATDCVGVKWGGDFKSRWDPTHFEAKK